MAGGDRLVIGIDFGTTYTGVAAVYSATPDDIEVIKTWPGGNGVTSDKVPTEFSYETRDNSNGAAGVSPSVEELRDLLSSSQAAHHKPLKDIRWGYQIKPDERRISCIKLFLDRYQKLPHFASTIDVAKQLATHERDVVSAVADFLAKIYEHALSTLSKRFGKAFMRSTQIEVVLTVPAIWSDIAKAATLKAAELSGIGRNVKLISEPEAAAVYTMKAIQPNNLRANDNIVVCDAGGGTVDLISYRIIQVEPLVVEELEVGTGALCGGAFLNCRFEEHMKRRLGEEKYKEMKEKKAKTWQSCMAYFEEKVKRRFVEDEDEEFNIPLPGVPDSVASGVENGFLVVTSDQVREMFAPIVGEVIALVEQQVSLIRSKGNSVTAIVLVGGFGQSAYLHSCLEKHFNAGPPPPYSQLRSLRGSAAVSQPSSQEIEIMQPINAWTAVVRGAVLRGLEGSIVRQRKARYHYGTPLCPQFDPSKHPEHSRYWDSFDQLFRATNGMSWYVGKGEAVSEQRAVHLPVRRDFPANVFDDRRLLLGTFTLLACDEDTAPIMHKDSFVKVCELTMDFSPVPRRFFKQRSNPNGEKQYYLSCTLVMKIDSASIEFELKVGNRSYSSVTASFDH